MAPSYRGEHERFVFLCCHISLKKITCSYYDFDRQIIDFHFYIWIMSCCAFSVCVSHFSFSIHLITEIFIDSLFWLLWIRLLWTWWCRCVVQCSCVLGIYSFPHNVLQDTQTANSVHSDACSNATFPRRLPDECLCHRHPLCLPFLLILYFHISSLPYYIACLISWVCLPKCIPVTTGALIAEHLAPMRAFCSWLAPSSIHWVLSECMC